MPHEIKLTRVMRALYCEPWLLTPQMHETLCGIAKAHLDGQAHGAAGTDTVFRAEQRAADPNEVVIQDGIAIIEVNGVIGRRFSSMLNSSGVTSIDVFQKIIEDAADNRSVRGVVLSIDSPGGTVTGVPEAAQAVERLATQKPVVTHVGGMMASAAYWIGAPSDAIFANQSADIGSIGVYMALLDSSRAYEAEGLSVELFKAGKFKAMGMAGTSLNDEQREHIQGEVDEIYNWFRGSVSANRAVPQSAMEGQTFLAKRAIENGLIDQIGSLSDAIEYAKQNA